MSRAVTLDGTAPILRLEGVRKSWASPAGRVQAVRGIDVSMARGETVALLGPNGAGKSTTIDMLLGLTAPDSGTVSLLDGPPERAVARGMVGAMLQAGSLIRDVKVRELIAMMAALHPHPLEVDGTLELAGLASIAERRTHKLSGGQAQRVRFAIALVPDPAVLILDEPTVGMDVEARRAFWLSVRDFAARGKTIIFAESNPILTRLSGAVATARPRARFLRVNVPPGEPVSDGSAQAGPAATITPAAVDGHQDGDRRGRVRHVEPDVVHRARQQDS